MITDDKVRYVSLNKNFVDKIVKLMEERNDILINGRFKENAYFTNTMCFK